MSEKLTIRNFGPIREAEMDIRDLTIFIGPQATGKSLAAQALYLLVDIEGFPLPENIKPGEEVDAVLSIMEWWFGNPPPIYTDVGTQLRWQAGDGEEFNQISWKQDGVYLGRFLTELVGAMLKEDDEFIEDYQDFVKNYEEQIYIPAGRILYSFNPPYSRIFQRFARQWPGYILTFYEILGSALAQLWQSSQQKQLSFFSEKDNFLQQRIDSIIKGQIQYGPDTILLEIAQKHLLSTTIAAGQMEIWPFWAILEERVKSQNLASTRIYFEEPEAHLHPRAQRSVMEMVAYLVQREMRFVLTTHSPYILYAVNNFLMAQKVVDAGHELPSGVPPEVALRPDQVAAYRFADNGEVYDIMDRDVGLIDADELEQVADDLGTIFSELQERLAGWE